MPQWSHWPSLSLPQHPYVFGHWTWQFFILMGLSVLVFSFFWIWALVHVARTPRAQWGQRLIWSLALLINPPSTIWYWCIWKRWAFWTLFTPLLGFFVALPFVIRSMMTKADANMVTNTLFALGSNRLVLLFAILMGYPVIFKLAAILHLSKNTEVTAMDRNDMALTMALPVFGVGSTLTYTAKYMKPWALVTLGWLISVSLSGYVMARNITPALIPAGDEKRTEWMTDFKTIRDPSTTRQNP